MNCLEEDFINELESVKQVQLSKGMTYVISDNSISHRSISADDVKIINHRWGFFKIIFKTNQKYYIHLPESTIKNKT